MMLHIKNGLYLFFTILLLQVELTAQVDSILLVPDRLGIHDIHITKEKVAENRIYTASRTLNNIEELPYSVFIITGEEIRDRGLFTLADVLKLAPSIFVSQPGSYLHGETFKMNGLFGNTNANIMIDNIPVKPYNASGTPIAQQLPIRQAERIEITYGPSALSNGAAAGAGTINIVTRKSDRPVYVYSDLAVGTQGYNSINVLFGGKLGKRKNTLKFSAYGTTSFLSNLNVDTIAPHYDPTSYPINSFSTLRDSSINIGELPLTSRQISINLNFRSFNLTLSQMQRTSHSAIGNSPASISYSNPTSSYGETINLLNFTFQKDLKKVGFRYQVDLRDLNINKESSFDYNFPFAKTQIDRISDEISNGDTALRDAMISQTNAKFFSGRRFAGGGSSEVKISGSVSFFPIKNVELVLSPDFSLLGGSQYDLYNFNPSSSGELVEGDRIRGNINLIARAYVKLEKVNLILGVNRFSHFTGLDNVDESISRSKVLPSVAGLYKINSKLSLKANYSNSFLIPSSYWRDIGGEIRKNEPIPTIRLNNVFRQNPQETRYGEIGFKLKLNEMIKMDLALFAAQNTNLLNFTTEENEDVFLYGYDNSDGRNSRISGIRFSIHAKNIIEKIKLNINANFNFNQGEQDLVSGETLDALVAQPKYITQFNISLKPVEKLSITIDNIFVGKYSSTNLQSIEEFNNELDSAFRRDANWSLHVAVSLQLNENFNIFLKGSNFTRNFLPGIDALGNPDDLSLNTQRSSYFVTGVSYNLD